MDDNMEKIMNDIFSNEAYLLRTSVSGDTITIYLPERVETNNADKILKDIEKNITDSGCDNIVFDCTGTKYVSSAGLRVFMRVYKSHSSVKFINLTEEVTEIFDITGFINIFL